MFAHSPGGSGRFILMWMLLFTTSGRVVVSSASANEGSTLSTHTVVNTVCKRGFMLASVINELKMVGRMTPLRLVQSTRG